MKKSYTTPEFELVQIDLVDSLCTSNPEGFAGDGGWGDGGEE